MDRGCQLKLNDYSKMFKCPDLQGTGCYCFQEVTKIHMSGVEDRYNPVDAHGILTYLGEKSRRSLKELSKGCESKNRNFGRNFNSDVCQDELNQYIKFIADSRQRLQDHGFDEVACKVILKYSYKYIRSGILKEIEKRTDISTYPRRNSKHHLFSESVADLIDVIWGDKECTQRKKYKNIHSLTNLRYKATRSQTKKKEVSKPLVKSLAGPHPFLERKIGYFTEESYPKLKSHKNNLCSGLDSTSQEQKYEHPDISSDESSVLNTHSSETEMPVDVTETCHQTAKFIDLYEHVYPDIHDTDRLFLSKRYSTTQTTQGQKVWSLVNDTPSRNNDRHTSDDAKPSQTTDMTDQNFWIQDYQIPANHSFRRNIRSEAADETTLNGGKTNIELTSRDMFATTTENTESSDEINTIFKPEGDNSPTSTLEAVQLSEMKDSKRLMDTWGWFC